METIVRESKPVQLEGVVKCAPDAGKWDGLDKLDVASKFNMFEKAAEERESDRRQASDRWDLVFKGSLGQSYLCSTPIICHERKKNSARWKVFRLNVKSVHLSEQIAHFGGQIVTSYEETIVHCFEKVVPFCLWATNDTSETCFPGMV